MSLELKRQGVIERVPKSAGAFCMVGDDLTLPPILKTDGELAVVQL